MRLMSGSMVCWRLYRVNVVLALNIKHVYCVEKLFLEHGKVSGQKVGLGELDYITKTYSSS